MLNVTVEWVRDQVEFIRNKAYGDPEVAHGAEDELFISVLRRIPEVGQAEGSRLAKEALKAEDVIGVKWYA